MKGRLILRPFWPALSLALAISILSWPSMGQSVPSCAGQNRKHHPYGNFDFETNSRIDSVQFRQYRHGLVSCISNNDKTYPLYARWFIPGPKGWVPANDKLESTPRLITKQPILQLDGCLEYGNRGDTTTAFFWGTPSDQQAVDDEKSRGCRAAATPMLPAKDQDGGTLEDIIFKIKNFFPFNVKDPARTMLQLDGVVGAKTIDSSRYLSFFTYQLSHQTGLSDDIAQVSGKITLRPAFRGPAEALLRSFSSKNPEVTRLAAQGTIQFEVSDVRNPELYYTSYEIRDENEQFVATIDLPVFVSSPK